MEQTRKDFVDQHLDELRGHLADVQGWYKNIAEEMEEVFGLVWDMKYTLFETRQQMEETKKKMGVTAPVAKPKKEVKPRKKKVSINEVVKVGEKSECQ